MRRAHYAGAAVGLGQDRARRLRPGLHALGVSLLSTGGTAKALMDAGLPVTEVADVHRLSRDARRRGSRRCTRESTAASSRGATSLRTSPRSRAHGIPTDRSRRRQPVPVRARRCANPGCTLEEAIENIDIGGPDAGARRGEELRARRRGGRSGRLPGAARRAARERRRRCRLRRASALAQKAFSHTAAYDGAISNYLTARERRRRRRRFPQSLDLAGRASSQDLRYGENPHQQAAFYRDAAPAAGSIATGRQLQGKELSLQQHRRRRCGVGVRARRSPSPRA